MGLKEAGRLEVVKKLLDGTVTISQATFIQHLLSLHLSDLTPSQKLLLQKPFMENLDL